MSATAPQNEPLAAIRDRRRRGLVSARPTACRKQTGFALIAVMWVVIIAAVMLLTVQRAARVNLSMAHSDLESVRARWLARAGIERAMAVLEDETVAEQLGRPPGRDSPPALRPPGGANEEVYGPSRDLQTPRPGSHSPIACCVLSGYDH